METEVIRVGSRKSELALIQTNFVIDCLKEKYPEKLFEIVRMDTLGDRILNISLPKIGEKSLFTKDLEDCLHNGTVDFVVHSLKDLPTSLPDGLAIGAVFEREDPRDAVVLRHDLRGKTLDTLPEGAVIGTSSLRRTAQLHAKYPTYKIVDVRGNLNTRLKKLEDREAEVTYAALILAASGLQRMGWKERISQILPCSVMKYAVGQGSLAVECRSDNDILLKMLTPFNHIASYCRALAERAFLNTLGGGCSAPVGVSTSFKQEDKIYRLKITGAVWSLDGKICVEDKCEDIFEDIQNNEETAVKRPKTDTCQNETDDRCQMRLYCGLSINRNVNLDVIDRCEKLGRGLAKKLIDKGALEVMKITQDYIRSSVGKS